jgi:thiosulfate reductase cytochrome b subunit
MSDKFYFYPVWLRLWHSLNAILCILLILTGVSMQYAGEEGLLIRFDRAVSIHNFSGVALTLSYTLFLIGNLVTSNGVFYKLKLKSLGRDLWKQAMYYAFGYFKGEEAPFPVTAERKFNPLQKLFYVLVMYLALPLIFITGWALLFPEFILKKMLGISGIFLTAQLHIVMGFFISVFLIIHLYVSTMGKTPLSNFKSLMNGWQESH